MLLNNHQYNCNITKSFLSVSGRKGDPEWLRMTNTFIVCDLVWKVQKSHTVNRECSFKNIPLYCYLHIFALGYTSFIYIYHTYLLMNSTINTTTISICLADIHWADVSCCLITWCIYRHLNCCPVFISLTFTHHTHLSLLQCRQPICQVIDQYMLSVPHLPLTCAEK